MLANAPTTFPSLRSRYNIQTLGCTRRQRISSGSTAMLVGCSIVPIDDLIEPRSALLLALPIVMVIGAVMSWWSFKAYPNTLFGEADEDTRMTHV